MLTRNELLPVKDFIVNKFTAENWNELGIITDCEHLVDNHPRLLRSLSFGDDDYSGHVLNVLITIVERAPGNWDLVQEYLADRYDWEGGGLNISSVKTSALHIYFTSGVFTVPDTPPDPKLVSVMMPFTGDFLDVYNAIKRAAEALHLRC